MKIFRNGLVYVDKRNTRTLPSDIKVGTTKYIDGREYKVFYNKNEIEYFKERKDIVDYDSTRFLEDKALSETATQAYRYVEFYSKKLSSDEETLENKNIFLKKFNMFRSIFYDIVDYRNNKSKVDKIVRELTEPAKTSLRNYSR